MRESTSREYKSLARHFITHQVEGAGYAVTPRNITEALKRTAGDYRPAYWRRLRSALAHQQEAEGYKDAAERIRSTRNPITAAGEKPKRKAARRRHVSGAEWEALVKHANGRGDRALIAALWLSRATGCRPAELPGITVTEHGRVHVPSAKRRDDRGLDRDLWVTDPDLVRVLRAAADVIQHECREPGGVKRLQRRLDTAARSLWPRRKAHVTFYSFRHQLGSELKASGLGDAQVAAVMGHRSVESVEVYGNRKRGGQGLGISVSPDERTVAQVNPGHREPGYSAKPAREPSRAPTPDQDGPGLRPG